VRVRLCGVRGSTPAPGAEFLRYGGHTSCLTVEGDGGEQSRLVLDAGTGIRTVTDTLAGSAFAGTILLTHLHWDHVQGLPFFAGADRDDARVRLLLPEQEDGTDAESVLERAMSPPHFPLTPTGLRGAWEFGSLPEGQLEIEGLSVLAREVPHKGGRTYGYRISDGRSTLTYMPDHCPTAYGEGPDGCGVYHEAALELADGTDLLVHDSHLLPEELAEGGRFGHASIEYAHRLGERAGARAVVAFHHAPARTDQALEALGERISAWDRIGLAVQGTVLEL